MSTYLRTRDYRWLQGQGGEAAGMLDISLSTRHLDPVDAVVMDDIEGRRGSLNPIIRATRIYLERTRAKAGGQAKSSNPLIRNIPSLAPGEEMASAGAKSAAEAPNSIRADHDH